MPEGISPTVEPYSPTAPPGTERLMQMYPPGILVRLPAAGGRSGFAANDDPSNSAVTELAILKTALILTAIDSRREVISIGGHL
jgi:hypothetical protein